MRSIAPFARCEGFPSHSSVSLIAGAAPSGCRPRPGGPSVPSPRRPGSVCLGGHAIQGVDFDRERVSETGGYPPVQVGLKFLARGLNGWHCEISTRFIPEANGLSAGRRDDELQWNELLPWCDVPLIGHEHEHLRS